MVHSTWQLEAIERASLRQPLTVWLKMDSGMHRVGLHPAEYRDGYQRLMASGKVGKIVLMSHFARADELDSGSAAEQVAVFEQARAGLAAEVSLRNSRRCWVGHRCRATGCDPGSCSTAPRPSSNRTNWLRA